MATRQPAAISFWRHEMALADSLLSAPIHGEATDRAGQSALSSRKRMAGLNRAFGPLFCSNQLAMLLGVETLDKQSSVLRRARLRYWTCAVVWVTQILPSFDQAERERGRGIREKTMASPSKPSSEALPVQLSPELVRKCKC